MDIECTMKKGRYRYKWLFPTVFIIAIIVTSCAPITNTAPTGIITATSTIESASPIPTITPKSLSLPTNYQVPSWLADPKFAVFAMVTDVTDNSNEITFFNADTHEKMIIRVPNGNISRFFWTPDGKGFGFIETDFLTVHLIDLKTGKVTKYHIPEQSIHCIDKYGKVKWTTITNEKVYSPSPLDPTFFCPKTSFYAYKEEKDGKTIIAIEKTDTKQKIETLDSNANLSIIYTATSSLRNQLAILQGPRPFDLLQPMGTNILIFDLINGKLLASFEGKYCSLEWSPDGKKLLTTRTDFDGCNSNALPVILYPQINQSQPINAIESARPHISLLNWSLDSNSIYYDSTTSDRCDICRYDLVSTEIFCPTKGFDELTGLNIEHYEISPDEKFIAFEYGYSCPGCDFWGEPSSALIRSDGSDLWIIGKEIFVSDPSSTYPYGTLAWRP